MTGLGRPMLGLIRAVPGRKLHNQFLCAISLSHDSHVMSTICHVEPFLRLLQYRCSHLLLQSRQGRRRSQIAVVVNASPSPWQQIGWQVAEVLDCLCLGDDGWR